jgi:hypothetical protein
VEEGQKIPARETERFMKLQEVILKAMARRITWMEAAELAVEKGSAFQRCRRTDLEEVFDPAPTDGRWGNTVSISGSLLAVGEN